jgi:hypothetical protein
LLTLFHFFFFFQFIIKYKETRRKEQEELAKRRGIKIRYPTESSHSPPSTQTPFEFAPPKKIVEGKKEESPEQPKKDKLKTNHAENEQKKADTQTVEVRLKRRRTEEAWNELGNQKKKRKIRFFFLCFLFLSLPLTPLLSLLSTIMTTVIEKKAKVNRQNLRFMFSSLTMGDQSEPSAAKTKETMTKEEKISERKLFRLAYTIADVNTMKELSKKFHGVRILSFSFLFFLLHLFFFFVSILLQKVAHASRERLLNAKRMESKESDEDYVIDVYRYDASVKSEELQNRDNV